eukprot:TRINITY_DN25065_c0_g1_i2.p1 TRINITY_DN25065_c0_g1~~TRINITY_DN25065_c0_g1_i2.p1  ORF type:complete len:628 (-),score=154.97 TRINITY_DN25065_c0_g1_i2:129-2012(-)
MWTGTRQGQEGPTAWQDLRSAVGAEAADHASVISSAREAGLATLKASIEALIARLQEEQEVAKEPDPALEAAASGHEGKSRMEIAEMKVFQGQQEFEWSVSAEKKVKERTKRQESWGNDALERLQNVLGRRSRRKRDEERPRTMAGLEALATSVNEAEIELRHIRERHEEKAREEAEELQTERRRSMGQTQDLLLAAMVIREEKERMARAWEAPNPRDKVKLMQKSLRRVRRLAQDMKGLEVMSDLKQKHSVLLYSLRMLESKLAAEVPGSEKEIEEGPVRKSPEQEQQLEEARRAFEEQLEADVGDVHAAHTVQAQREVAEAAQEFIRTIGTEHGWALPAAHASMESWQKASFVAKLGPVALKPFLVAAKQLCGEECRHTEVENGATDAAGFGPVAKRMTKALATTLVELQSLENVLSKQLGEIEQEEDAAWKKAFREAEARWRSFREAHPATELNTARGATPSPAKQAVRGLRQALEIDDLDSGEVSPEGASTPVSNANAKKESGGGRRGTVRGRRGDKEQSNSNKENIFEKRESIKAATPKARPPTAGAGLGRTGPPKTPVGPVPATPGFAGGGDNKKANGNEMGTAVLSQLDELSKKMDNLCGGKNGTIKLPKKTGGAKAPKR